MQRFEDNFLKGEWRENYFVEEDEAGMGGRIRGFGGDRRGL